MKKKEKRMILILVIIAIIIIAVLVKVRNSKNDGILPGEEMPEISTEPITYEDFVEESDDGTRVNKSQKIAETKKVGDYEISNIQITEKDDNSQLIADVKNIGNEKKDVTLLDITLLDQNGGEMMTVGGILGELEPGDTTQLNVSSGSNLVNAYDLSIVIKDE